MAGSASFPILLFKVELAILSLSPVHTNVWISPSISTINLPSFRLGQC